ncbi:type II secretory pathway, component PulF [Beggiatoa alba B18LD]|uniref:Type II secretory pathway, component PulF n=1 Tax=Beggiatoa alba B18LD TaxID=395493 RepID=I3CIA1_9GAMM|nr:type II secretion system F family protein [Beggiatoa alba]EIJ43344.1 type II secretory pathway, component PulF [Beggiatoa alba B18LD]
MHAYTYQACDNEGNIHTGKLNAENEQEIVMTLQSRQLVALKIELSSESGSLFGQRKISNRDLIDFTNGLCTLVEARVPLDKALVLLEGLNEKPVVQQLIADLHRDVKEGKSLADALQAHPDVFSKMYINMVHAGEEGGILEHLLPKVADFLAAADDAKRTVISAMIYPVILLITGVLSVILLMIFVIPQFADLFKNMGTKTPDSAAFLLATSTWLKTYWWSLPFVPVLAWVGWRQLDTTPEKRLQRDQFILQIPILGNLLLQAESSRFSRTLGALLGAGIPLLKALSIVRGVMTNEVLADSLKRVEEAVRSGVSLGKALVNEGKFPVLLAQLVIVGEESGRTGLILDRLAETFDTNVKQQTARLVAAVEPILILVLGIIVGTIVIIMLSAIFSITSLSQ